MIRERDHNIGVEVRDPERMCDDEDESPQEEEELLQLERGDFFSTVVCFYRRKEAQGIGQCGYMEFGEWEDVRAYSKGIQVAMAVRRRVGGHGVAG